jgi:outer membrane protein TolC
MTLAEAIARARADNADVRAAVVAERVAAARIGEARAGWMPRLDVVEGWQRGNQPVFVFSSLLSRRQFTAANFAIEALNHPESVDAFRTAVLFDQVVFDGGGTRAAVRGAELGRESAALTRDDLQRSLAVAVTEAFGRVLQMQAERRAAAGAVASAVEDLARARARSESGLVTEADVLAMDVHLANVREHEIRAAAEERVARARLNEVIGAPLDQEFELLLPPLPADSPPAADLEQTALGARAEVKQSMIREESARVAHAAARSALLPQVAVQGGWEWNGGRFSQRAGSWLLGTEVRLNLFRGFGDSARMAAAAQAVARAAIERERAETAVRVDVRAARARLDAARAREAVGRASVNQAGESQRIVRDRYEHGLADVTELLRAAQALLQAESQATAARIDVVIQSATLDRALGR